MKNNEHNHIRIRGARVHNLQNIALDIPHNRLVVITGLSGSGKSTLAFDTIFAEGQRRYVESLSAYARQFLGRVEKPDVDAIEGIAPAIAIEQKVSTRNPRSTVGTSTEIYDYLKLLFARIGRIYSPQTGREVRAWQPDEATDRILALTEGSRVHLTAPLAPDRPLIEQLTLLVGEGIRHVWHAQQAVEIDTLLPELDPATPAAGFEAVVDRLLVRPEADRTRIVESVARAYVLGDGVALIHAATPEGESLSERFTTRLEEAGVRYEPPTEHLFSFNNPLGACPRCEGYGKVIGIDEDLVIPDKSRSVYDDAVACWRGATMKQWKEQLIRHAARFDFPIHTPYYALTEEQRRLLWRGNDYFEGLDAFFRYIDSERRKIQYRVLKARYTGKTLCPECGGTRLRPEALCVRVGGRHIAELVRLTADELLAFFQALETDEHDRTAAGRILQEITTRLRYLIEVGLGYLTLDRLSATLSGGESQRINLSTSLGSNLTGSLYILDEPSIGLHPRDTARLVSVLRQLRDLGNTVIVVEHEEEVIRAADWIVDIGPGAGEGGGRVLYNGPLEGLATAEESLTADYLSGRRRIVPPPSPRGWSHWIGIEGASENNLQGIDVRIPLGVMTCLTGVSGSGKSTLVDGILYPALRRQLFDTGLRPGSFRRLGGDVGLLRSVELVDQNPIGKSSRSNPVTYLKAYDEIRRLFADQPYAVQNGMGPAHFSFNVAGGRCEECQGEGTIKVSMQFMADIELRCEACGGRRFRDEVLEVRYRGRTISDVLEMTVDEAIALFGEDTQPVCRRIVERLQPLSDVGLGYIRLGQSSSTLSGGESQRVKLASFLSRDTAEGHILFIFDEPTTGLHFHDIRKLLDAFSALVERGHTVLVVEHNVEVIRSADWVVDLGPEAGDRGGRIVFAGTPLDLMRCAESHTGRYLAAHEQHAGR